METESALIGVLLQKNNAVSEIAGTVYPEDFKSPLTRKAYTIIYERFREGKPTDFVILAGLMPGKELWIAGLSEVIPINHREYAIKINSDARKRRIIQGVNSITSQKEIDLESMLAGLSKIHREESCIAKKSTDIKSVVDRTRQIIHKNRAAGRLHGIDTGFGFLRENYMRYVPGHMWVITGFTSTGKTTLAGKMRSNVRNNRAVYISTEMTEDQIIARDVAAITTEHNQKILSGAVDDIDKIERGLSSISKWPHTVVDNVRDIAEVEAIIMQEHLQNKGEEFVVFIDYVQKLRVKGTPRKEWGAECSGRIQDLAKIAKCCIVCFSQVSNEIGRGVSDQFEAKGAGEWAADCDVGVRLMRSKQNEYLLIWDQKKGRHYGTLKYDFHFINNYTDIVEHGEHRG